MTKLRIGHGYDVHRLTEGRRLILGGVEIEYPLGLMGHSDAGVTMNVYTHASYDHAEASMKKILQFKPANITEKTG